MPVLIISIAAVLPLLIAGFFFRRGKGLFLLAGYNTMSPEAREKIDRQALGKKASALCFRLAAEFAALGVCLHFGLGTAARVLLAVAILDPCVAAVGMSRMTARGGSSKTAGRVTAALVAVTLLGVLCLFAAGEKEPAVQVTAEAIDFDCMYGQAVPLARIERVELLERSMREIGVGTRTNGYGGVGTTLKGNFSSPQNGEMLLFVRADASPTLRIVRNGDKDIYLSFRNAQETRQLYEAILNALRP